MFIIHRVVSRLNLEVLNFDTRWDTFFCLIVEQHAVNGRSLKIHCLGLIHAADLSLRLVSIVTSSCRRSSSCGQRCWVRLWSIIHHRSMSSETVSTLTLQLTTLSLHIVLCIKNVLCSKTSWLSVALHNLPSLHEQCRRLVAGEYRVFAAIVINILHNICVEVIGVSSLILTHSYSAFLGPCMAKKLLFLLWRRCRCT